VIVSSSQFGIRQHYLPSLPIGIGKWVPDTDFFNTPKPECQLSSNNQLQRQLPFGFIKTCLTQNEISNFLEISFPRI
jgi:hypothetical protein